MFTNEPSIGLPLTKADLESELKAFAKGELAASMKSLHNHIKKDVQNEVMKLVDGEGALTKVLASTVESVMNQVAEKNRQALLAAGAEGSQAAGATKLRRRPNKTKTETDQTRMKKQALVLKGKQMSVASLEADVTKSRTTAPDPEDNPRELEMVAVEADPRPSDLTPAEPLLPHGLSTNSLSPIETLVLSPWFEYGVAVIVILNVIMIGAETEIQSSSSTMHSHLLKVLDMIFCFIFTTELGLRVYVYREQIWLNAYLFQSTSFDALLVALQIVDLVVSACSLNIHVLSVLRIVRIARIIRLLHLFDELSVLITGMTNALSAMLWTVLLQALFMYMFSIFTMQVLITTGDLSAHDDLGAWFGSVERAICTMFEVILGGVDWSEILHALNCDVSPFMGIVMSSYIVMSLFFLMNLVCGVFVERVTRNVREDKDEMLAKRLSQTFTEINADGSESEVTWEDFASKLSSNDAIQAYFQSIDVYPDANNARGLFELIDADGSGEISGSEIVAGCLRLRGPAKAFELALLGKEVAGVGIQAAAGVAAAKDLSNQMKELIVQVHKIADSIAGEGDGFVEADENHV